MSSNQSPASSPPTDKSIRPVFQFGDAHPPLAFRFGERDGRRPHDAASSQSPQEQTTGFSFSALHNATPSPSPGKSPQLSPRTQPQSFTLSPATPNAAKDRLTNIPVRGHAMDNPRLSLTPPAASDTGDVSLASPRVSSAEQGPRLGRGVRSTSSVSIASSENVSVTPYDIHDEEAPSHRFFTREFQSTLRKGLDIARRTVTAIKMLSDLSGPKDALDKLLEDANRLSAFHGSDTRTIAVLGDSGEGNVLLCRQVTKCSG